MTRTYRKLLFSILVVALTVVGLQSPAFATVKTTDCPAGTFSCTCNGSWVGCVTTIAYCWNAC
jgi:hypothetical protein